MTPLIVALAAVMIATASAAVAPGRADRFVAGSVGISTTSTTKTIAFADLAPGDSVTSWIAVRNVGSLDLEYALTLFATNPDKRTLSSELELTIKGNVSDCSAAGFDVDGTALYGPDRLGSVDGIVAWGNPARAARGSGRIVETGDIDILCMRVSLPARVGNVFQGAKTSASFRFDARSVAG